MIWDKLRTPDSFPSDWYGEVTNQAGHNALVGVPATLFFLAFVHPVWVPVIVVVVYAVAWEYLAQHGTDWKDSLTDTASVGSGSAITAAPFYFIADFWPAWTTAFLCWLIYFGLICVGVARRT